MCPHVYCLGSSPSTKPLPQPKSKPIAPQRPPGRLSAIIPSNPKINSNSSLNPNPSPSPGSLNASDHSTTLNPDPNPDPKNYMTEEGAFPPALDSSPSDDGLEYPPAVVDDGNPI